MNIPTSSAIPRLLPTVATLLVVVAAGCASPGPGRRVDGAAPPGAPPATASRAVIDQATAASSPQGIGSQEIPRQGIPSPDLPDRMEIPATYRLVLLDGRLSLVRDTDPVPLSAGTASLRIITGEIARGEIAYQPALLPQELAAELAASHSRTARLEDALETVMDRSQSLLEQTRKSEDENRRLSALLAAFETRLAAVEARPASPRPVPAGPAPANPPSADAPTAAPAPPGGPAPTDAGTAF